MIIDTHTHWLPPALAAALRDRERAPRIALAETGERLFTHREGMAFRPSLIDIDARLAELDRAGIDLSLLSLPGLFGIDSLPAPEALPLVQTFNDELAGLIARHPGRFAGLAALPIADMAAAVAELERGMGRLGLIGAILPVDGFLNSVVAQRFRPVLGAANRLGGHIFLHPGPVPADGPTALETATDHPDNGGLRHIVLGVQARLASAMMTLCMTNLLDPFPNLTIHLANLGGSMPMHAERMDHIAKLRMPDAPPPSSTFGKVMVDTATFGPRGIALAVAVLGADRVMFGTDDPIFDAGSQVEAMRAAPIAEDDKRLILAGNAERLLARFA